ncbi:hypothetical protein F442_22298 [Phytophthora nicotianae P10297]|uniref:Uncharacterized protein n=1 Tax=Phytophthora nicotianae P10297 TaxID=1317064 RepID=W2Y0B7_PHYNI|nr:hypothetical protein F442_22298 [Phytophthora nicotianae P10297]
MAGKNTPEVVPVKWSKWNNVLAKVLEFVLPHPEGKLLYHGSGRALIMPTLAVIGNAC